MSGVQDEFEVRRPHVLTGMKPRLRSSSAPLPKVTVIVLNWCGEKVTTDCLESLAHSDYPALDVLLVDNASPDGSGERLHESYPELPYLQTGENLGYAGGNNRGIDWALAHGADLVLILNNDTVVHPRMISRLVAALESHPEAGAVAPKILRHDAPDRIWIAGGVLSKVKAVGLHRREGMVDDCTADRGTEAVTFISGCCMLITADALQEVGGFNEGFFAYIEDVELSIRLMKKGYGLLYEPSARLLHHSDPPGKAPSPFQIRLRDRNRRRVAESLYRWPERLAFRLFFYPSRLVRFVSYLARTDFARARAIWQGALAD